MSWIELELHRMRAAPADLPSSDSRIHLASPGRSPSEIADLTEAVSGAPIAVSSDNLYLASLPQSPSEIADLTEDVSEVPASSPDKGSAESWELINTDAACSSGAVVQQVCTVKRYRKPSLPLLATQPAIVADILQAFPKVSSDRSRSPAPLVDVPALPVQPLDPMHADHRHRLGLGSRLQLRPARPLPCPAVLPRSTRPCFIPPAASTATPPMPRAKQRAAFYAKHSRVPRPAGTGVTSLHAAGSSPTVVPNSSAPPTLMLGSGVQCPHRGGSVKQAQAGLTLQQSLHQQQFADVLLVWATVRPLLLAFSPVLQDLERSAHSADLELGLLRTVAESTALRYLHIVRKFLDQLRELWNMTWDSASQSAVVDCILSLSRDHQDCHRLNSVKALRWIAKLLRLQVDDLYDGLFRPLVTPNSSGKLSRESYPLPWRLVSYLEEALIFRSLPRASLLLAGALLVCVFGSLRWSDSQHLRWDTIIFSASCLRALIFRTKTSRSGMPVALRGLGVLGQGSAVLQTWAAHYLELLSSVWIEMRVAFGDTVCPDCLWFTWDSQEATFSPLTYAQSLRFLREAAVASGLTSGTLQAQALTLHSMKVCLLSAMLVLKLSRAVRCAQGHHRGSSAELCSRDDVWEALEGQDRVLERIHAGWLPLTPMARGGQSPIQQLP